MNLQKCKNGHFYDTDKYASCPHCAKSGAREDMHTEVLEPAGGMAHRAAPRSAPAPVRRPVQPQREAEDHRTLPVTEMSPKEPAKEPEDYRLQPAAEAISKEAGTGMQEKINPEIFEVKTEDSQNHTVGYYSRVIGTEPVVGWLVCTEGDYFGESFKLKSGRNFIGRSSGMDVVLSSDMSVSRSRHGIVVYEPRKRIFIAQPGESRELFYLNDEVVLSNMEMHAYDVLTIGTTKLMLIPCCGERFSWEDQS